MTNEASNEGAGPAQDRRAEDGAPFVDRRRFPGLTLADAEMLSQAVREVVAHEVAALHARIDRLDAAMKDNTAKTEDVLALVEGAKKGAKFGWLLLTWIRAATIWLAKWIGPVVGAYIAIRAALSHGMKDAADVVKDITK